MNRSNPRRSDRSRTGAADFLQLRAADAPAGGLSAWLAGELRAAITDGRLRIGSRLPASRVLAGDLRVSRGVVTEAYQRLVEDGHLSGRGRAGTIVVASALSVGSPSATGSSTAAQGSRPAASAPVSRPPTATATAIEEAARTGLRGRPGLDVFDRMRATPARFDLTPGVPDLSAFPRAAWLQAERRVLRSLPSSALGYTDPAGTPELRQAVAGWLARNRGIRADPAEVIIVSGVAQALALVAQVLTADGHAAIAVEDPGSLGARLHLNGWGLATPPVPVDADGLRVEELARSGVPAVLLTPAHQFPTGVVLDGERRRELIRWAGAGGLIVEDDYDAEHRYDRPPVPALRAMLPEQVVYTGSISKLLAPALRIGWLLAPSCYHRALTDAKRLADLGTTVLPQLVTAELMESGELERQLRFARRRHRRRRDAIVAALGHHLPRATVHGAAAGLHLTVTFPGDPDASDDVELAATALEHGVKTQPLSWHCQRPHTPGLVLGYAARTPAELTDAVGLLAGLMR